MNDTTNTTSLRERHVADLRSLRNDDGPDGPYSAALDAAIAALSPPALEGMPDPIAYTRDNGPGKVVGLEWNPRYPVHTLRGRIALYASPVAAQAVTDTARLDWLEKVGFTTRNTEGRERVMNVHSWASDDGSWKWSAHYIGSEFPTARAAIDAALAHPNAAPCDAQGASNAS